MSRVFTRTLIGLALLSSVWLAGCDSKNDANEKNLAAAMTQYLDKRGQLCRTVSMRFPVDLAPEEVANPGPNSTAAQMAALVAVGLMDKQLVQVQDIWSFSSRLITRHRHTWNDAAKPYLNKRNELCYGQMALDKITKWDVPAQSDGRTQTRATYTAKVVNIPAWTQNAQMEQAFSFAKTIAEVNSKPRQHPLVLTNQGWEAAGLECFGPMCVE